MLAADGINPKNSILGKVDGAERGAMNRLVVNLTYSDIPTASDTYVLGKLPVGAAVTNAYWVVSTAFSDGVDFGITDVDGTAGTDGNVDIIMDDNTTANHTVGIYRADKGTHASNNYAGHLCITDSYVTATPSGTNTAGVGTLVVEYIETL